MKAWTVLLPVFVYAWLARKCEVVSVGGQRWHVASRNILIRARGVL